MPITFNVANKPLEKAEEKAGRRAQNAADAAPSIAGSPLPEGAVAAHNGFVDTIVKAYNNHHHLILRPDDVWIAIITQFSAYMEKYAEALRDKFVSHQGQIELEVRSSGSLFSAPYEAMALQMTELIADKLKDPSVRDWVLPKFSTTTPTDTTVGAIALMASMKAYFQYKFSLCCGIPKVTLEGTVEDWEQIEARAARLLEFDNDKGFMRIWYHMLKDVLAHFTLSAKGTPNIDWWQRVCSHLGGGSGPRYLSGWVTVFCVFSDQGDWQGDRRKAHSMSRELSFIDKEFAPEGWPVIDTNDLPSGECKAPVLVDDNGTKYDCMLIAGHKHMKADGTSLQPWVSWRLVEQKNMPKPKGPREHF